MLRICTFFCGISATSLPRLTYLRTGQAGRGPSIDGVADVDAVDAHHVSIVEPPAGHHVQRLVPAQLLEHPAERVAGVAGDGEGEALPILTPRPGLHQSYRGGRCRLREGEGS